MISNFGAFADISVGKFGRDLVCDRSLDRRVQKKVALFHSPRVLDVTAKLLPVASVARSTLRAEVLVVAGYLSDAFCDFTSKEKKFDFPPPPTKRKEFARSISQLLRFQRPVNEREHDAVYMLAHQ